MAEDLNITIVHNCLSHAMRAAKILVTQHYSKKFRKEIMYWISLLYASSTFDKSKKVMQSLIVLLNCEKNSNFVKKYFEKLRQRNLGESLASLWDERDLESSEHIAPHDFLEAPRCIDEKQELNSNFYFFFKNRLHSFIAFPIFRDHQKPPFNDDKTNNVYFDAAASCERLIRVVISWICSTSQLMLGDLSRHYVDDGDISRKQAYQRFSSTYRNLEHSSAGVGNCFSQRATCGKTKSFPGRIIKWIKLICSTTIIVRVALIGKQKKKKKVYTLLRCPAFHRKYR